MLQLQLPQGLNILDSDIVSQLCVFSMFFIITPIEAHRDCDPAVINQKADEDTSISVTTKSIPQYYELVKTNISFQLALFP